MFEFEAVNKNLELAKSCATWVVLEGKSRILLTYGGRDRIVIVEALFEYVLFFWRYSLK